MAGVFYKADLDETTGNVVLEGEEAHHAATVRRVRIGEEMSLTNGAGLMCHGKVVAIDNKPPSVTVSVNSCERQPRPARIHLAAALPKGDRQRTMLDMATQVGMDCFTPLSCERSVSKEGGNASERWRKIMLEAMKQSRRAWLPEIRPSMDLPGLIEALPENTLLLLASGDGQPAAELVVPAMVGEVLLLVGPEGGFTAAEREQIARAGAVTVSLVNSVLRTETAAVLATGLVASRIRN